MKELFKSAVFSLIVLLKPVLSEEIDNFNSASNCAALNLYSFLILRIFCFNIFNSFFNNSKLAFASSDAIDCFFLLNFFCNSANSRASLFNFFSASAFNLRYLFCFSLSCFSTLFLCFSFNLAKCNANFFSEASFSLAILFTLA